MIYVILSAIIILIALFINTVQFHYRFLVKPLLVLFTLAALAMLSYSTYQIFLQ